MTARKRRPRLTKKVRSGLIWLAEYAECWLVADEWDTPAGVDEENGSDTVGDMRAALEYLRSGALGDGLS